MIIRIAIFAIILFAVVSYILRKRNISIGLTPLGKTVLFRSIVMVIRLILKRFGL